MVNKNLIENHGNFRGHKAILWGIFVLGVSIGVALAFAFFAFCLWH